MTLEFFWTKQLQAMPRKGKNQADLQQQNTEGGEPPLPEHELEHEDDDREGTGIWTC